MRSPGPLETRRGRQASGVLRPDRSLHHMLGTCKDLLPEQPIVGALRITGNSDLQSRGAVVERCASGGGTPAEVCEKQVSRIPA
jgi:hypothetical protein